MATTKFSSGYKKKRTSEPKGARTKEVAGPYRSQSSEPEIREKSTPREHRRVKVKVPKSQRPKTRARRAEKQALRILKETPKPPNPHFEYIRARDLGEATSKEFKEKYPRAAKEARKRRMEYISEREPLKEDPAAEFIISTAATAGLGAGAKAIGTALEKGAVAAAGSKLAASGTTAAESAAENGVKAIVKKAASKAKAAPAKKVRSVKSAPKRARDTVKRAPELKTKAGQKAAAKAAGKKAARHPVRTGLGASALSPVPLPGEADKRVQGFVEGSANAVAHHPEETLKTTLRALPAAITGPVDLAAAAGASALHGTTEPLKKTASEQFEGMKHIAEQAFSGDPKKAEEAARKEGSLTLLTPLPAVTRTRPYKAVRDDVRGATAAARRKLAKGERGNRNVRHAPKGVEQNVFAATARREARKKTALVKQRADNPARVSADFHERRISKHMAKAPKGSDVALQTLAEYGVRDARGVQMLREKGPGDKQLAKALDYVEAHPEVFKSKDFKKALEALAKANEGAPAALVGKGERARLLQQGDLLGHTRPEHRVPVKAREFTKATTREGAWGELAAADKQIGVLRKRGRERLNQAKVLKGAERKAAAAEGRSLYAQARALKTKNQQLYNALKDYTRPDQAIDGSARRAYDDALLKEYASEVESGRRAAGLDEAVWTHHAPASGDKGAGIQNRFPTNAGRVEHMREGNLAKADDLDRSLEGLVRGTVHLPRLRGAGKQFGRDFVKTFQTPFTIDGKAKTVGQGSRDWQAITAPRSKDNPNGGQFDPKSWARFPVREWKNAVKDPFTTDTELHALLADAEAGQIKGSEPWVLMPREAIKEARAQINPDHGGVVTTMNAFSRVANRLILGTNPAWAVAQTVAEGVPLIMAKPSLLLNPKKLASIERDIHRFRKEHPEEAMALQATAGASPVGGAALRTPLDQQETYTPALWEKGAKALTRGKTSKAALSFVKLRALGEFDVRRQNAYRTALAAAEADKRFRSWHSSLTGLFDKQARLSKRFKTRGELWTWLTTDPKGKLELQKITDYVDDIQGNWTAFTRHERNWAPFTIFYPFLRYSLRWTLWTFPKRHPATATIAYMLGQANANQLEKLVGEPLANPIAYTYPVFNTGSLNRPAFKEMVAEGMDPERAREVASHGTLPGGSRISPGQSSITQALASGNPAAILSSTNPFIGAGIVATTGVEPFTGEEASIPRGQAAANALLSMPTPLRLSGAKFGDKSPAAEAFAAYDPLKAARSFAFPFIPQSGAKFRATEKLGKAFDDKYSNPVPGLPPEVWEAAYGKDWKAAKELRKLRLKAEKAGDLVRSAEEPFFDEAGGELDKEGLEILKYITGVIQIPVEEKKKPKVRLKGGVGGSSSGGIGGYSLGGGSIGGSVGGSIGGGIGGHPIGG